MNKSKLLIFDFDGTIVDSKKIYYSIISKDVSKFGYSLAYIDKEIDKGMNVSETLKDMGFPWYKRMVIEIKIMFEIMRNARKVKKCKDVESLRFISIKKILVSNSFSMFVDSVLRHAKIREYFSEVYGSEHFDDKAVFIKGYLRRNRINKKECFYIGDRAADVKVARRAGVKSVAISNKCSWDSRQEILKESPDFLLDSIKEIKNII